MLLSITTHNIFTEMNGLMLQMRHTAHELRATLDQVRQGTSDAVSSQGLAEEEISLVTDPEGEMRIPYHIAEVNFHTNFSPTSISIEDIFTCESGSIRESNAYNQYLYFVNQCLLMIQHTIKSWWRTVKRSLWSMLPLKKSSWQWSEANRFFSFPGGQ